METQHKTIANRALRVNHLTSIQMFLLCRCVSLGICNQVCLYMPMVPAAAVAMLACARLGAPHSVVFAGFSADALRDRINDGHCRYVITADEGKRGGKVIPLKITVDAALAHCPNVKACLVVQHTNCPNLHMQPGRDIFWNQALDEQRGYCPCEPMDSEDILFMLFTSGSTGKSVHNKDSKQQRGLANPPGPGLTFVCLFVVAVALCVLGQRESSILPLVTCCTRL